MLAIIAGIAVGIMVAIGGEDDRVDQGEGLPEVHRVWVDEGTSLGYEDEEGGAEIREALPEAAPGNSRTRLVLGALAGDGTPESVMDAEVGATAVADTVAIEEATVVVPVGDAVERWRPLVASIFPDFAVDAVLRVIRCESGGNPNATGHAGERGLLQIHPLYHPDSTYDPEGNLRAGYRISSGGTDWSAWTCRP